uniref:Uncharacterized protein n=1 Tax=Pithovirus LCPAC404 TaxID=2506597 RepID=A0A481ZC60_9VIRU|nr:MAG: uncharacterized protein LCPAC404_02080 [Pithovirus LCPAC404]
MHALTMLYGTLLQMINYFGFLMPVRIPPPQKMGGYMLIHYQYNGQIYSALLEYSEMNVPDDLDANMKIYCTKNNEDKELIFQPGIVHKFTPMSLGVKEVIISSEIDEMRIMIGSEKF